MLWNSTKKKELILALYFKKWRVDTGKPQSNQSRVVS